MEKGKAGLEVFLTQPLDLVWPQRAQRSPKLPDCRPLIDPSS